MVLIDIESRMRYCLAKVADNQPLCREPEFAASKTMITASSGCKANVACRSKQFKRQAR
jgi:hypothetical protein